MAGRQLTDEDISKLLKLDAKKNLTPKAAPAFSKTQTLAILDAVSDRKLITDDGEFIIEYTEERGYQEFFVCAITQPWPHLPCGHFITDWAMERLSL